MCFMRGRESYCNLPWPKEGWIHLPVALGNCCIQHTLSLMVTLFASVSQGDNYETIVCDDYMLSVKYTVSDNYGLLRWLFGFD